MHPIGNDGFYPPSPQQRVWPISHGKPDINSGDGVDDDGRALRQDIGRINRPLLISLCFKHISHTH